ncbi:hypothetical protein AB3S75_042803 [Citrus x aurantiifolia]
MKLTHDNKIIVEYNDYGIPVGEGGTELRSYIGVVVRDNVSILYNDWRRVPLEIKEKCWDHVLTMGTSLRNFRSALITEFIQSNKDHYNKLKLPPTKYPRITKSEWQEFVDRMLGTEFQKAELEVSIKEIDRNQLWLMAQRNSSGGYEDDVQQVARKIEDLKSQVEQAPFTIMESMTF